MVGIVEAECIGYILWLSGVGSMQGQELTVGCILFLY